MLQAGIERRTPQGGGTLQYEYASREFIPFGEAVGPAALTRRSRERWLASLGGTLWGAVSGGVNYVSQTRWNGEQVTSLGLSLSMPQWHEARLSLSANKRLDGDRSWLAGITVSFPLGGGINTTSRVNRNANGQLSGAISVARNAPAGGRVWAGACRPPPPIAVRLSCIPA